MSLAVKGVIRIANEESKLGAKLGKSLNRLHTGMGHSKTNLSEWGYMLMQQIQPVNA